ncbi:MAG: ribonuclease PH [Phycisphaeraceae bacterium]|nr:ribonuclease PH [Phycisphaeraceae bacterium]
MTTRRPTQLRPVTIEPFPSAAPGSVLISAGNTRVACTAGVSRELPPWLAPKPGEAPKQGWVTAEYAMLPASTPQRKKRGADSRATEIQRLIGRALRAAIDLNKMPGVTLNIDCDVICADGGTRTAAITGGYVALALALRHARKLGWIERDPIVGPVAAVSVGVIDGIVRLDLDYALDVAAEVDLNVAMTHRGQFVEVQGTAEHRPFSRKQLDAMLTLATSGIRKLMAIQRRALR